MEFKAADAKIEIIFAEENTLLIRGQGEGIGLEFDRLAGSDSLYDYVITIPYKEREFYEANLFRNASKYIFGSMKGKKSFAQDWQEQTAKVCKIVYEAVDGEFEATVEEAQVEWKFREYTFSFDENSKYMFASFATLNNISPISDDGVPGYVAANETPDSKTPLTAASFPNMKRFLSLLESNNSFIFMFLLLINKLTL